MNFLSSLIEQITNWFTSASTGTTMINTVLNVMKFSTEAPYITTFIKVTAPIGMVIMVVHFMLALFRDVSNEREPNMHILARAAIYLLVGDVLLSYTPEILGWLMGLSNTALDSMAQAVTDTPPITPPSDLKLGLLAALAIYFLMLIGKMVGTIGAIVVYIVCISAKIELILRFVYAPIGFASVAQGGNGGESIRYLKKLVASCFYCAAILVALFFATTISQTLITNGLAGAYNGSVLSMAMTYVMNCFYTLIAPLAAVGTVTTVKSIVNESFGA